MLAYTAEQLLAINNVDLRPARPVRKAIFSLRLWGPIRARPAAVRSSRDVECKQSSASNVNKSCEGVRFGLLNTQTLAGNRPIAVSDTIATRRLDIVALTETWHQNSDDIPLKRCAPPGYSILDAARRDAPAAVLRPDRSTDEKVKAGGGIAVVYNDRFAAKRITFDVKPSTFEVLGCSLRSASTTVVYVVIYRPGTKAATEKFFTELTELFEIVATFRNEIIISGDFNVHVNDAGDWRSRRLADLLESFGLVQSILQPTHVHGNTLDLVITRPDSCPANYSVDPPKVISDHAFVVCVFSPVLYASQREYRSVRPWKKVDKVAFSNSLKASILCTDIEELRCKSAEELFIIYDDTLRRLADYYAPASIRPHQIRRLSPWFDDDCRCSRRLTRLFERRYRKSRTDADRTVWVAQMRAMHSLYQQKENLYWSTCIASNSGNPKKMWRSVSAILKKDKESHSSLPSITADKLSQFFKEKVEAVRADTADATPPVFSTYSGKPYSSFREYTMDEVRRVLVRSPPKTCSLDPIPTNILLESVDILLPFIWTMCNASISEGSLPASQKTAIITPVLKKPNLDADDTKSYRPISNLTFISKVIERIVAEQIKVFLTESNLMPPLQSAYRPGHSTETAILKVLSDILDAADSQKTTLLSLLDMSAAFDTVDFKILLQRLEVSYGLGGTVLKWLSSFITDRTQAVSFGGAASALVELICGVPQGSVLGPLLFVLYAADVMKIAQNHGVCIHAYADDLQTYVSCSAADQQAAATRIIACVADIDLWMSSNRLKLNASKTEFIWLGTRQQLQKISNQPFNVDGVLVAPSNTTRDLGVWLDGELTMNAHVNKVVSSCFYQLRQLRSVRRCLSFKARQALTTAFIASRLDYCNAVFYGIAAGTVQRLQIVMNAAARLVAGLGKYDHVTPLLRDVLHWLPVPQRITFKIAALTFDCIRGSGPEYFSDVCTPLSAIPGRSGLRAAERGDLFVPTRKSKIGSRSFKVAAPTVWNSLPQHLHLSTISRQLFRRGLKTHLFQEAYNLTLTSENY